MLNRTNASVTEAVYQRLHLTLPKPISKTWSRGLYPSAVAGPAKQRSCRQLVGRSHVSVCRSKPGPVPPPGRSSI